METDLLGVGVESPEVAAAVAPTMASAILGLTPRWVMLLGAVLLLLLPGASAEEPPGMGKARGPRDGGAGRLGRIQGGVQPAGLASSVLTPSLGAGHSSHCWELTSCPEARKTGPVGTDASVPA